MKRSPMPARKSGLRRVAMSPRRTPLRRSTSRLGLRSPSRPRVSPEERRARRLVKARSAGWCEARGDAPATEWHHRKRRSQGGPWSASNGMHVCHGCHVWLTSHPVGALLKGWSVRSVDDPAASPACLRGDWVLLGDDGSVSDAWQASRLIHHLTTAPIGGAR